MRLRTLLFTTALTALLAGEAYAAKSWRRSASGKPSRIAQSAASIRAKTDAEKKAYIGSTDIVFPHLAVGGSWESEVALVNLGSNTVSFSQFYYDQAGNPMAITIRSLPDGQTETTDSIDATLGPGERFTFLLSSDSQETRVGWSYLDYITQGQRLGGFVVFRAIGGPAWPDLEAVVPLSAIDDFIFFLPYDNLDGFTTSMAIVNGSIGATNEVSAVVLDQDANVLERKTITLAPGEQRAFALTDEFPATANNIGTIYFEGSFDLLSALALRFNPSGAFTTVPVLNWPGNFQ